MVKLTRLYKGLADLQEYLEISEFDRNENCFVRIFTSSMWKDEVANMIRGIKLLLPNSSLIGSSSSKSIIHNGQPIDDETIVIIETYKHLTFECASFNWKDKSFKELAKEVYDKFTPTDDNDEVNDELVNILFSECYKYTHAFVDEINKMTPVLKLVGGIAGDIYPPLGEKIPGYVFTYEGIIEQGVVAFKITNKPDQDEKNGVFYTNNLISAEEVSQTFTITKTNGSYVEEIENTPAIPWIYEFLGINEDDIGTPPRVDKHDYLSHFPFIFDCLDGSVRCAYHHEKDENGFRFYFSDLPELKEGLEFKMGYVNPEKTIKQTKQLANSILEVPVESIFVYSCLFRNTYLKNSTKWEFAPFDNICVSGMYTIGEIGYASGKNIFYNATCIFTTIAEEKKYIVPKFEALDVKDVKDDIVFAPKTVQVQKEFFVSPKTKTEELQTSMSVDASSLKMRNFNEFKEDAKAKTFDKMCLIEVQSADATIAFAGHNEYYTTINNILDGVEEFMQNTFGRILNYYSINYKTFLIPGEKDVLTNDEFIANMRIFHASFDNTTSSITGLSGVTRFVVVLNQVNLVEVGMNILFTSKENEETFLVCDTEFESDLSTLEEQSCITLLKSAVDREAIVPFYQGIHNNKNMKIEKYEALMRIVDEDGTVHAPGKFMEVAKKYKFYRQISKMMIARVFEEFADKQSEVSFNISTHDLEGEDFKAWLIEKIVNFPNPKRIIVEFVETESYMNADMLTEFIDQLHALGSRIAIDDFGSGYSTFATVLELRPDFIKIDGSIVSQIEVNENSVIVLDTISYLARRMNVECVAEFVENAEIQKILDRNGVEFSQGYYYAKPMSNEQLIAKYGRSDF